MKNLFKLLAILCFISLWGCSNSDSEPTYTVTLDVSGLESGESFVAILRYGYRIASSSEGTLTVTDNGETAFSSSVDEGYDVIVEVSEQPDGKTCTVESGFEDFITSNETFDVICSETARTVSLTVSGLTSSESLSLSLNRTEEETIDENGEFTFSTEIADGADYEITQVDLPAGQRCELSSSSGTATADVSLTLTCQDSHIIFEALNDFQDGDFGGRDDADTICQDYVDSLDADVVSCDRVVAFLSVDEDDQISDFGEIYSAMDTSLPVYFGYANPQGSEGMRGREDFGKLSDDWADLLDGSLDTEPFMRIAWTGSNSDGTVADNTCSAWTSTSGTGNLTRINATGTDWLTQTDDCSEEWLINCLCLQEAEPEPTVHVLFPSTSTMEADFGGRETADEICATSQAASFGELQCDGVAAVVSYDDDDEVADFPTMYGLDTSMEIQNASNDNARVADNWADFVDGSIDSAIGFTWWSATLSDGSTNDPFDCMDWTSTDAMEEVGAGSDTETGEFWSGTSANMCDEEHNLMCLCYQEE